MYNEAGGRFWIWRGGRMEQYEVVLVELETSMEVPLLVEADEAERTENFEIKAVVDGQEVCAADYNYFPAFQMFRDKLLLFGYGMKCNGSRINAVQSGMQGATDRIYLVEMGRQALMKDTARIFDYADIDTFPNTTAQMEFFEKWSRR